MKRSLFLVLAAVTLYEGIQAQNTSPYWSLAGNSNASSTASKLGTTNSIPLRLFTNNAERMRLDVSGNAGIGTGTATLGSRLVVNTASGSPFRAQINGSSKLIVSSNGGVSVGSSSTGPSNGLYVSGNVGIGTTTPAYKLHVIGNGSFSTGLTVTGLINSSNANGDAISASSSAQFGTGVYATGYYGIWGSSTDGIGIFGQGSGSTGVAVRGNSVSNIGIWGSTGNSNSYAGYFQGNIYTSQSGIFDGDIFCTTLYESSDSKLKQNINELTSALEMIKKLQPKAYEFRHDGNFKGLHLPQGKHFGFLAQDVEQVLPVLIKERKYDAPPKLNGEMATSAIQQTDTKTNTADPLENGKDVETMKIKAVNYTELIPILVKAMQEQQLQIEELSKKVNSLQNELSEFKRPPAGIAHLSAAFLEQNTPNPSNTSTIIRYFVPSSSHDAQMVLMDMRGEIIKSIAIRKGSGQVVLNAGDLAAGTYTYSLRIDGAQMVSKQMIVAH